MKIVTTVLMTAALLGNSLAYAGMATDMKKITESSSSRKFQEEKNRWTNLIKIVASEGYCENTTYYSFSNYVGGGVVGYQDSRGYTTHNDVVFSKERLLSFPKDLWSARLVRWLRREGFYVEEKTGTISQSIYILWCE